MLGCDLCFNLNLIKYFKIPLCFQRNTTADLQILCIIADFCSYNSGLSRLPFANCSLKFLQQCPFGLHKCFEAINTLGILRTRGAPGKCVYLPSGNGVSHIKTLEHKNTNSNVHKFQHFCWQVDGKCVLPFNCAFYLGFMVVYKLSPRHLQSSRQG